MLQLLKARAGESYDVMMLCAARKVEAFQLRWPNRVEARGVPFLLGDL
jgi:hypothetical protein